MPLILAALILAVSAAPAAALQVAGAMRGSATSPPSSTATVWGQVRSEASNLPLRYAIVELVSSSIQPVSAVTDSSGFYVLKDVPPGRRMLRVTHMDHAPHEVEVLLVARQQHVIDFDLEFRPVRLSAVFADGARGLMGTLDTVPARESDLGPATVRVLESTPGVAELGLSEAARDVPGHEPVDPADVLYVRGGSADLKLVLLNGAPVYAPFHIGGLINALDTDVLRSASLQMGGAPARYDGGLSYIMDLETRAGRSVVPHGLIALDMLSGRTIVEGPVGSDVAFLASARTVHGLGTRSLMNGGFPYGYGDALGRVDFTASDAHVITATGFWNHERVQLDTVGAVRESASWGNRAGSLRYRGAFSKTDVIGTVAVGQFRTLLPLGGIQPLVTEGTALRTKVTLDLDRAVGPARMQWGGGMELIDFEYRAFPQGVSRERYIVKSSADGEIYGLYGDATFSPTPRLRVRGGLRADVFSADPGLRLAPRLSATVLLTDRASLTLSGGRYNQYVRAPESSLVFLGNVVPDSGDGSVLVVAQASHLVLALAQDLGEGIRLGLDGFFKEFTGLDGEEETRTNASGMDLWVRRNTGAVTGWLGYSLAWIWTVESGARPQEFSGRHLVSAGVVGPIIGRSMFDVRVSYGAGLPYTAIPEPEISSSPAFSVAHAADTPPLMRASVGDGPVPTEPQQAHIRLDAQVSRTFSGTLRHLDFHFTPYVRVINALNRRDAIFYHYSRDAGRAEPVADLPIVPIVGLEWKF